MPVRNVKVTTRIRPLLDREMYNRRVSSELAVVPLSPTSLSVSTEHRHLSFDFHRVLGPETTQKDVFEEIGRQIVEDALNGYDHCCLTYGQSGSGKTHTMLGDAGSDLIRDPGLVSLVLTELYSKLENARISMHAVEIYGTQLFDLLSQTHHRVRIRERNHQIYLEGITKLPAPDTKTALKHLLRAGRTRLTGANEYCPQSSRSHALFFFQVSQSSPKGETVSLLTFGDLAGSEKLPKGFRAEREGRYLAEVKAINQGCLDLSRVINALASNQRHIPYRDGFLTRLLEPSLRGGAFVSMIICLSPSVTHSSESVSSLRFGLSIAQLQSRPEVKRLPPVESLAEQLRAARAQIAHLIAERQRIQSHSEAVSSPQTAPTSQKLAPASAREFCSVGDLQSENETILYSFYDSLLALHPHPLPRNLESVALPSSISELSGVRLIVLAGNLLLNGHTLLVLRLLSRVEDSASLLEPVFAANQTMLHLAAAEGSVASCRSILGILTDEQRALTLQQTDIDGQTALFHAIISGNLRLVSILLRCGADPNVLDVSGECPLGYCFLHRFWAAAKLLIQYRAFPTLHLVHRCVCEDELGWLVIFSSILSQPARGDISALPSDMQEALTSADLSYQGIPLLNTAAQAGALQCIAHLLQIDADPLKVDNTGDTALHAAVRGMRKTSFSLLCQSCRGRSFEDLTKANNDHASVVDLILFLGWTDWLSLFLKTTHFDPLRSPSHSTMSLLEECLLFRQPQAVVEVLKIIGEEWEPTRFSCGLLECELGNISDLLVYSCLFALPSLSLFLLDRGASVDHFTAGINPLTAASLSGCLECASLLLNRGADPSLAADGVAGLTCWHLACLSPALMRILLDAPQTIKNLISPTILDFAVRARSHEAIQLLIQHGVSSHRAEVLALLSGLPDIVNQLKPSTRAHIEALSYKLSPKAQELISELPKIDCSESDALAIVLAGNAEMLSTVGLRVAALCIARSNTPCDYFQLRNSGTVESLCCAVVHNNMKLIDLWTSKQLDKPFGARQRTPLHYAVAANRIDCAKSLVIKGFNVDQKDALGLTPIDIARHLGSYPLLTALGWQPNEEEIVS